MSYATPGSSDVREIEARLGVKGRRVFTQAGWNESLRKAGMAAGAYWIATYGPLRFNRGYATSRLGYRPGGSKRKRMARGEAPFFHSGAFRHGFERGARTVAVAKRGRVSFAIVAPGGRLNHHPEHVAAFRRVPTSESAAVAREFRRALIQAVQVGRAAARARAAAKESARAARAAAAKERKAAARKARSTRRMSALGAAA